MNKPLLIASAVIFSLPWGTAFAQQPPEHPIAVAQANTAGMIPLAATEMDAVIHGWSIKKDLLGKTVRNDANQNLGTIGDIIVTPKDFASYAIVDVGGFLGIGEHRIAVPMRNIQVQAGKLILPGATKDALKALPPFVYAH